MNTIILNRAIAFVFAFALLFGASNVYAEENDVRKIDNTTVQSTQKVDVKEIKPLIRKESFEHEREQLKEKREERREKLKDRFEDEREHAKDRREDLREKAEDERERFKESKEDLRERIEKRRAELRERGLDKARDRIAANAKRFVAILEAGIDRMERIIDRIESRMEKLADDGVDTSLAELELDGAKESLFAAFLKIEEVKGESSDVSDDSTPREKLQKVRELLRGAHQDIKDARKSIRAAIKELKDAISSSTDRSNDAQ